MFLFSRLWFGISTKSLAGLGKTVNGGSFYKSAVLIIVASDIFIRRLSNQRSVSLKAPGVARPGLSELIDAMIFCSSSKQISKALSLPSPPK